MGLEQQFVGRIVGECAARLVPPGRGLGVFIEHMPPLDAAAFLEAIGRAAPKRYRVAVLGGKGSPGSKANLLALTSDPTEANRWRNDEVARGGTQTIVLIVGPAPKVNSLRTALTLLQPADICRAATDLATSWLSSPERRALYTAIGERGAGIATQSLLQFIAHVEQAQSVSPARMLDSEPDAVHHLGLLRDRTLFSAGGLVAARRKLRRNLDLVDSLRSLSPKSRAALSAVVDAGTDLTPCALAILKFNRTGQFGELSRYAIEDVESVLRGIDSSGKETDEPAAPREKKQRVDGDALALDFLLNHDGHGLGAASKKFNAALDQADGNEMPSEDLKIGQRTVVPRIKVGTNQSTALFGRLLSEEVWGGLVVAEQSSDLVSALKLVASGDARVVEFKPGAERSVRPTLVRAVNMGLAAAAAVGAWDAYVRARAELIPRSGQLIDHPLMALGGDRNLLASARNVLTAYGAALDAIRTTVASLEAQNSIDPARRLLATALALDVTFVRTASEFVAVAAPTHPFHLWRWVALIDLLQDHKTELADIGIDILEPLVSDPPAVCPGFVLSPYAVEGEVDRVVPFLPTGSFASLPLFAEPTSRQSTRFRVRTLGKVAERLIRLMPHAALGLRVALVDPPSVAGCLEDLLELPNCFDEAHAVPLHAIVVRTRAAQDATDEEEQDVANLARELTDQGGTLTVLPTVAGVLELAGALSTEPVHLAVVFSPGSGSTVRIGVAAPPPLSPLAAARTYHYDAFDDRLDVIVAGDSAPFGTYHEMFCRAQDVPRTDFMGRRSGVSQTSRQLEGVAKTAIWLTVVDQTVEPTLRIGGTERLDWRSDSGRDVVTYTAHTQVAEDLISDALRAVGLAADEESRKRMLRDLFLMSGEAVLNLAKAKPGSSLVDPRVARGTIGVLAASRWYAAEYPGSIVISLDDPASRRWVLGIASDNRHGDLLAVRPGPNGVVVDALEVKAHDAEDAGVRFHAGVLEGGAINQIDQTIAALKTIFEGAATSPVTRVRLEVLKDQLYRAVASRPYASDQRARHVQLLEELFNTGIGQVCGTLIRVKIEPGRGSVAPTAPRSAKSPAGNPIADVELIEGGPAPRFRTPPPPPEGTPTAGGSGPGSPQAGGPRSSPPRKKGEGAVRDESKPSPIDVVASQAMKPGQPREARVLIGDTPSGSQVFWDPQGTEAPLNNFGMLITGDSGAGKTQVIKAVIAGVIDAGLPVCIFDFKNDYGTDFAKREGLKVYDIDREGLPFNPLSLVPDDRGEAQPIRQVHELASILRRIFTLGDQQEAQLKKAMIAAYDEAGIRPDARHIASAVQRAPGFGAVKEVLERDGKAEKLLNRLSPLFDLNLFPSSDPGTTFERLVSDRVVLDLHRLPDDRIKAALSEFMIVRLHGYMLRGDQPRQLRRLLVLDEAWRVKDSVRLQELAREGRAFGVGITIGTQFPGDIPETLAGNLATQLLLLNHDPEHRKTVVRTLCGATSGPAAQSLMKQVSVLQKHEGFFRNSQYTPYTLVTTLPYYQRQPRAERAKG